MQKGACCDAVSIHGSSLVCLDVGGGYASSGYSTLALRNADYWVGRIRQTEKRMADNMRVLKPAIEDICGRSIAILKLRLLWIAGTVGKDETYTMAELDSGLIVQMNVSCRYIRVCSGIGY